MSDRYKRFVPHEDNVQEIISADHVNELQDQISKNQEENFKQGDTDFLDRALFVLDNHPIVNTLYVDLLENIDKVDLPNSPGLMFNKEERSVTFDETGVIEAILTTRLYTNPNATSIRQIIFMASTETDGSARINFELSNNGTDFFSVVPNESQVFEFPTTGSQLQIRATFVRNLGETSPMLKAYAILFRDAKYVTMVLEDPPADGFTQMSISHQDLIDVGPDDHHPKVHSHNGLDGSGLVSHLSLTDVGEDDHHPKNHQHGVDGVDLVKLESDVVGTLGLEHFPFTFWTGYPGDLELTRNPNAGDKLVKIKTPDDEVFLFYDWNDPSYRLIKVVTIREDIAIEEDLSYGDYVNSKGMTETVMTGTMKQVKDATDADIQSYIAVVMAPRQLEEVEDPYAN